MKLWLVLWLATALATSVIVSYLAPGSTLAQGDTPDKDATIAALETRVASQQATVSALQTRVSRLETAVAGPSAAAAAATRSTGQGGQVLLDLDGSGTTTTRKFAAPGDWNLAWRYDCSSFFGGTGNFQVFVYNGDGSLSLQNMLVNQLGGNGNGIEHYHQGGTVYLVVNSECAWHIAATVAGA